MYIKTTKNRITSVRWTELTFQIELDTTLSKQNAFLLIELVAMIMLITIVGAIASPWRMYAYKRHLALG